MRLSLADTTKPKKERPARLYKQLQATKIALQPAPENTPDHIIAVAGHPPAIDAQRIPLEANQTRSTYHRTIVTREKFALHALQLSQNRSLQEDTLVGTTLLFNDPHTSRLVP